MATLSPSSRPVTALFRELLETEAWSEFQKVVREQVEAHSSWMSAPLASLDATLMQEFEKGVRTGLELALSLPDTIIKVAEQEAKIRAQIQAMENDNGN